MDADQSCIFREAKTNTFENVLVWIGTVSGFSFEFLLLLSNQKTVDVKLRNDCRASPEYGFVFRQTKIILGPVSTYDSGWLG